MKKTVHIILASIFLGCASGCVRFSDGQGTELEIDATQFAEQPAE